MVERKTMFCNGLHCIGIWHSHPEPVPPPPRDDLEPAADYAIAAKNQSGGILFAIIGTAPFPSGVGIWMHDGTSPHEAWVFRSIVTGSPASSPPLPMIVTTLVLTPVRCHCPAHDLARVQIQNSGQIKLSSLRADVGDISHPGLVGPAGGELPIQNVGHDRQVMPAVDRVEELAPPARLQLVLLHEPSYPVVPGRQALSFQDGT